MESIIKAYIYTLSRINTDNHKYKYKIIKIIKMLLPHFEVNKKFIFITVVI